MTTGTNEVKNDAPTSRVNKGTKRNRNECVGSLKNKNRKRNSELPSVRFTLPPKTKLRHTLRRDRNGKAPQSNNGR